MKKVLVITSLILWTACTLFSQINYTANEFILDYNDKFRPGVNPGWYAPWNDDQLGQIAMGDPANNVEGAAVTSMRPGMFEYFYDYYGYDFRVSTFQGYADLGSDKNVGFIGYPAEHHQDFTEYCPGKPSWVFSNLYEPIWVEGSGAAIGTAVINEENYFARYVFNLVSNYKDYIHVWEVWNEPDYDYVGNGWKPRGMEGNWWENNPDPCEYALQAPIQHYVRMLRIAYTVIHAYDDDAYVAVGGIGYGSFLDAVLRNTDNPDDGALSDSYPEKGGAYFDVLSFHYYPHIDATLREWSNDIVDFKYFRHSDRAADGIVDQKASFENVLLEHGYDGQTYPSKHYICTETNIPRKQFGNYIGSDHAQRNFIQKVMIKAQMNDIHQVHLYNLGEFENYDDASNEFQLMGLFKNLNATEPYNHELTPGGVAFKTNSQLLENRTFDKQATEDLRLPEDVDGGVFADEFGLKTYVLWAKTNTDQSEDASAVYSFPSDFPIKVFEKKKWNYAESEYKHYVGSRRIRLRSSPIYLTMPDIEPEFAQIEDNELEVREVETTITNSAFTPTIGVQLNMEEAADVTIQLFDRSSKLISQPVTQKMMDAGNHVFEVGNDLMSGIYFVHIMVGNKLITEKIFRTRDH